MFTNLLVTSIALTAVQAPLRVIVSHDPPDAEVRKILDLNAPAFKSKAEELGYVVMETPLAVYVHPANLYNIAYVKQCMDGLTAVSGMLRGRNMFRKFSEMTANEREGIRMLLADKSLMSEYGPLIGQDGTMIHVDRLKTYTISDGKREVPVNFSGSNEPPPDGFVQPAPATDEVERFAKSPKYKKEKYSDSLVFTFAPNQLPTMSRGQAIEQFGKRIAEVLEGQFKAWTALLAQLEANAAGVDKLPESGQAWQTLSDAEQRTIEMAFKNNYRSMGFESESAAAGFLAQARIKNAKVTVLLGIGVKKGDQVPLRSYTSINVVRN